MLISSSKQCSHIDGKNAYNQPDNKWRSSTRTFKCHNESKTQTVNGNKMCSTVLTALGRRKKGDGEEATF